MVGKFYNLDLNKLITTRFIAFKNTTNKGEIEMKTRKLNEMAYDKTFDGENCHATGYVVCLGNENNPGDWWVEYIDSKGVLHYGR